MKFQRVILHHSIWNDNVVNSSMFKFRFTLRTIVAVAWVWGLLLNPSTTASQGKSVNQPSVESGPILGSASAPVTIIEFSDFQCSYCKRFWADTLPKLKDAYIDQGKVRFTYRHFAILGKHSEQAAQAAECAAAQGKFWEYHDQLFKNQGGLAFTETKLRQYARDIGLNVGTFGTCLGTGKYKDKVERETTAAAYLGGRGTPFFIVNQRHLVGAQPFDAFRKVIDEELDVAKVKKSTKDSSAPAR
jgi:protein-disulfide isomerase